MSSDLAVRISDMEKVSELFLKSNNPSQIAKIMNIPRTKVITYLEEWKNFVHEDMDIRARAKETLAIVDQHYQLLLVESWEQLEEAKRQGSVRDATGVIKLIAQIEKDRATLYQSAGLTADDALADELSVREGREEIVTGIIKRIAGRCEKCKRDVFAALSQLSNEPIDITPSDTVE